MDLEVLKMLMINYDFGLKNTSSLQLSIGMSLSSFNNDMIYNYDYFPLITPLKPSNSEI